MRGKKAKALRKKCLTGGGSTERWINGKTKIWLGDKQRYNLAKKGVDYDKLKS